MSGALAPRVWRMSMRPVATDDDDGDHRQDQDKENGAHALRLLTVLGIGDNAATLEFPSCQVDAPCASG